MGCFNDLPNDVKWLVFREIALSHIRVWGMRLTAWEEGCLVANSLTSHVGFQMMHLSLIEKRTWKLVRSKCFKFSLGWLFIRGAITVLN